MKTFTKVAIGTVALVAVAIIGVNLMSGGSTVGELSAGSTPHPAPSLSAVPLPVDASIVHGWPGARRNPAGRYSWSVLGKSWMHNPHDGNIGVSITFSASANAYTSGATAVSVAGYDGTYQELLTSADGIRTEVWIVDIEDTRVTITVEAQPGTTETELAEAYAVLGSLRSEPRKNDAGFRLTFTLPDGWDSG